MTDQTIRFLIEQKVSYVNSTVHVCMSWWVTSIVFCSSVLAAVWLKQADLQQQQHYLTGLGIVLFAFFFVIAYFGYSVTRRISLVQTEIASLAKKLGYHPVKTEKDFLFTEIRTFQMSMWFGVGSFGLVFIVWIFFWYFLSGKQPYILIGSSIWIAGWISGEVYFWRKRRKRKKIIEKTPPKLGLWIAGWILGEVYFWHKRRKRKELIEPKPPESNKPAPTVDRQNTETQREGS